MSPFRTIQNRVIERNTVLITTVNRGLYLEEFKSSINPLKNCAFLHFFAKYCALKNPVSVDLQGFS
jgi:hypothetical protein